MNEFTSQPRNGTKTKLVHNRKSYTFQFIYTKNNLKVLTKMINETNETELAGRAVPLPKLQLTYKLQGIVGK
jgi:hypothetical protein